MRARVAALAVKWAPALGSAVRGLPGAAGALLVSVGLGMVAIPLGVIAAGVFLLAIDRRVP